MDGGRRVQSDRLKPIAIYVNTNESIVVKTQRPHTKVLKYGDTMQVLSVSSENVVQLCHSQPTNGSPLTQSGRWCYES